MTHRHRPFVSLPLETREALLRCAQHGAATSSTLMDMSFASARKSRRGSPLLRNENSRLSTSTARKRLANLVKSGYLARTCVVHETTGTPLWTLVPHHDSGALSFIAPPTGDLHTGIVRSRVAAGLTAMGYVTGRNPETLKLWSTNSVAVSYRCTVCGGVNGEASPMPCARAPRAYCRLQVVVTAPDQTAIPVTADVALRVRRTTLHRLLVWVDDGRALDEQWAEIAPLALLTKGEDLMVVVRPNGFDSAYSRSAASWPTHGPRLAAMGRRVLRAGLQVSCGGSFGHRFQVA